MYKKDLVFNNWQSLIYHKNQPTNQPTNPWKSFFFIWFEVAQLYSFNELPILKSCDDFDVLETKSHMLQGIMNMERGCLCGVMVKAMDCGIVVSKFILQSHYYIHFQANILGKGMNRLILPAMG